MAPERPFIPHRTPKSALQAVNPTEFRLARPFVPGAERATSATFRLESPNRPVIESSHSLPPIDDFLDSSAPIPAAIAASSPGAFSTESEEQSDELPPLEHFLDPLPPIGEFAADAGETVVGDAVGGSSYSPASGAASTAIESEWVEDDWQRYDWRAAAALGEGVEAQASQAWATTDWDNKLPRQRDDNPPTSQAIANALDQIAQQIREGGLTVPAPGGATDPAAIAATLAALLGIRQ